MKRARAGLLAAALMLLVVRTARADTPPNVWDIAKDPRTRDRYQLHVAARQAIMLPRNTPLSVRESSFQRARAMLEGAEAASSPDVRLRFDLGEIYQLMNRHERAVEVLRPAIESAPDHPGAIDASLSMAYAYAKLDHPREERDAYVRFLARSTDERARTTALLNLAEAEMRLGNLPDAVTGYRDAVQSAAALPSNGGTSKTAVLAVWGLAIALDRSGDPAGAAQQARLATELDFGGFIIGDTSDVFFVPEYERFWYFALSAVERAKDGSILLAVRKEGRIEAAKDPRTAAERWAHAEALWGSYVTQAERAGAADRWLPLARAHREHARVQKIAAQKIRAKAPPAPLDPDQELVIP